MTMESFISVQAIRGHWPLDRLKEHICQQPAEVGIDRAQAETRPRLSQ